MSDAGADPPCRMPCRVATPAWRGALVSCWRPVRVTLPGLALPGVPHVGCGRRPRAGCGVAIWLRLCLACPGPKLDAGADPRDGCCAARQLRGCATAPALCGARPHVGCGRRPPCQPPCPKRQKFAIVNGPEGGKSFTMAYFWPFIRGNRSRWRFFGLTMANFWRIGARVWHGAFGTGSEEWAHRRARRFTRDMRLAWAW